jgi:2-dehydro-3-deoxyphosphogluconate aldolase / (4S)-4-hydroxy-2-oxoglutarate aldolase
VWDDELAALRAARVVPVVTIGPDAHVEAMADGLRDGGIGAIEITLRTRDGLDAIRRLRGRAGMLVGAGTVLTVAEVAAVADAGARFVVSPGLDPAVVAATRERGLLPLPGIATPTELQTALALGLRTVKVFPAELLGGVPFLTALSHPFPEVEFMPSGGIRLPVASAYLAHAAVVAVGGSWIVPTTQDAGIEDVVRRRAAATVATLGTRP